jgi:GNAT superfamily N-acetyltransferase
LYFYNENSIFLSASIHNMIKAQYSDKKLITNILTEAFDSNISVNYVVRQDKKRKLRILRLMEYTFDICWEFGEVYLTSGRNGAVLIQLPHAKKTSLKSIFRDIRLVLCAIGIRKALKVLKMESKIKEHYPSRLMYISFIGILPNHQGKGIGSELMQEILYTATENKIPVYLETSMSENIPFYAKFNFEMYHTLTPEHVIYMFRKETS